MGRPSFEASNAIIYLTYGAFLVLGTGLAWKMRNQGKGEFLAGNRTQTAIPLALNFIAAGMGSGIFFTYPELGTLTGVQGVVTYAIASSSPLLIFAWLGPIIRRKCPEGFVLTEWTRQRYGIATALWLSFLTLVTLFLYMVSELSAVGQVVSTLTGLESLPVMIVQIVVTTIYTSLGGFSISFITDNVQGAMIICLIIIAAVTMGAETKIDTSKIEPSGLTDSSLLGWQLLYILPVAVLTNDFFLSNFWLRTFASKTDKDLWIGVSIAASVILVTLTLVGSTGFIAAWSGAWTPDQPGGLSFFLLLEQLPNWVVGVILVMVVSLSTASFDSLQSAMVSSASNDLFRNRLNIWWIRGGVVLITIPVIVLALKAPSILQIYLISDLLSSATIPVLCIGLLDKAYWWRGCDVFVGSLGGILSVFIFGAIYFDDVQRGADLMLLESGLYQNDWSAFGAFVAAPVGGLIFSLLSAALRLSIQFIWARVRGHRFEGLDRPAFLDERNDRLRPNDIRRNGSTSKGSGTAARDVDIISHTVTFKNGAGKFF